MGFRIYALLLILALIPRAVYLSEARNVPLFSHFYLDSQSYDRWAQRLAAGDWAGERAFHMAPVYPYLLGVFYKIFGRNLVGIRILQHLTGAVSCLLVYLIARRLFTRRVAWLSFFLAVGYGPFIYFEGQLLASFLGVFSGLLSLHLLIRGLEKRGRGLTLAGLVLGIGSVARPNLAFFMPMALLWLVRKEEVASRHWTGFLAAFLVAFLPTTAHNYIVSKDFVPISSHGGVSFYLGNNSFTPGTYVPPPEFGGNPEAIDLYDSKRLAERELGRPLKPSEISNYWYGKSLQYIRSDLGGYARLLLRKTALYFNSFEIPLDVNYEFDKTLYPVFRFLPITMGLLIPLALVGSVQASRGVTRGGLLVLFVAANAASVVAFFVCARYRQTAVPAMGILAALVLAHLYDMARAWRWRPLAAACGALLLLSIPVRLDLYPGRETGEARSLCIVGKTYAASGNLEMAEMAYRDALDIVPGHIDTRVSLGLLYYVSNRPREAAEEFAAVTRLAPQFAGAWNNLGNALREGGEPEGAVRAIEEAVRIDPRYASAYNNLGYTLALLGRAAEAEEAYRRALDLEPGLTDTWANLADLLLATGRLSAAVAVMEEAVAEAPLHRGLRMKRQSVLQAANRYEKALVLADGGDLEEALATLRGALADGGTPLRLWAKSDPALELLRRDPRFDPRLLGDRGE